MNFQTAMATCLFQKYCCFAGRAPRSEYWFFWLGQNLCYIIICWLCAFISENVYNVAVVLVGLALILPSLSVTVRRLHDTNRSGWWIFICFVPLIGQIWLLILMLIPGTFGPNRYGPDPLGYLNQPLKNEKEWH